MATSTDDVQLNMEKQSMLHDSPPPYTATDSQPAVQMGIPVAYPTAATATTTVINVAGQGGAPPPGAPLGGRWESINYCGPISTCIFCFVCVFIVCCPVDTKQVYIAPDGRRFNQNGTQC
mmetsp:Transcript_30805/g.60108  ORF Transcript_30805/g.60108 Transcript_30805/m.60108 type:complete len:120 (+) Transcript_30805:29-388(+)